jgi:hypothetical protein
MAVASRCHLFRLSELSTAGPEEKAKQALPEQHLPVVRCGGAASKRFAKPALRGRRRFVRCGGSALRGLTFDDLYCLRLRSQARPPVWSPYITIPLDDA